MFVQEGKTHDWAVSPQSKAAVGNGRPAAATKVISSAPMPATFFFKWAPPTWTFPKNKFTVHLAPEPRPSSRPSPFQLFSVLSLCLTKQDRACSLYTAKKKKNEKKENREGCLGEGDRGRLNLFWILPLHPPPSQCGNYPSSLTSAGSLFKNTSPLWCFVHRNHGFHLLLNRRHHSKKNCTPLVGEDYMYLFCKITEKKVWPLSVIVFFFYYLEFEEDKKRSSEHHLQLIISCACIIIKQTDGKLLRLLL